MMLLMFSPVRHDASESSLSLEGDDDHTVDGGRHQDMLEVWIVDYFYLSINAMVTLVTMVTMMTKMT